MQHLEEGTIHAWLDGALSDDEAADVAKHVDECADCSAMVAEARGLIAGASRIVGSLDVVRGGVIPGAPVSRGSAWRSVRFTPARAAIAATLILAVGSVFTIRHTPDTGAGRSASVMRADSVPSPRVAQPTTVPATPTAAPSEPRSKTLRAETKGVANQVAAAQPAPAPVVARQDANPADRSALSNKAAAASIASTPAAPAPPQAAPIDTLVARREALRAAAGSGAAIAEQRRGDSTMPKRLAGNVVQLSQVVPTSSAVLRRDAPPTGTVTCYSVSAVPDWASGVPARFALDDSPVADTSLTRRLIRRVTPDGKIDGALAGSWWQPGSVGGGPLVTLMRPAPATPLTIAFPVATGVAPMDATLSDPARTQRVLVMRSSCTP